MPGPVLELSSNTRGAAIRIYMFILLRHSHDLASLGRAAMLRG
jgi:hypothetical protein